jgi:hypothetical protein
MELIGLLALLGRPLADVLDRERGDDLDHLLDAAEAVGLEHHPAQPGVDGELGEPAPERGQALLVVQRRELLQQADAVADLAPVRRVQEREVGDVAEPRRGHLEDHRGEVRAQDLRVGVARALLEVLLRVEPDGDAVGDAAAAALALVGGGLRDRLDRQPLHLQARAVAADPRSAGIDDVADPGHRERRLGHVRGQHDATTVVRLEDALLLARGEPRVERQDVDVGPQPPPERLRRVADLALAREEDEHVPFAFGEQLLDRVADRVRLVAVGILRVLDRPVADLDGVGAARHLHDRRAAEVTAEALRVDGRGGDDHLEVRPPREDAREVAEQEVDVEAALVRLVDDHRVVAVQQRVVLRLCEQQPVRHEPDQRLLARAVAEAHGIADRLPERHAQLERDPLGDGTRRQPPRLRVGDRAAHPAPQLQAQLGQLRGLARARLPRDHHDLVVADRRKQVLPPLGDRQLRRVGDGGDRGAPAREPLLGAGDLGLEPGTPLGVVAAQALRAPAEPVLVADRQLGEARHRAHDRTLKRPARASARAPSPPRSRRTWRRPGRP